MIGFAIHIEWGVRYFVAWLEFFRVQVQVNIKEVDDIFVCFDGDFQVTLSEYMAYFLLYPLHCPWGLLENR